MTQQQQRQLTPFERVLSLPIVDREAKPYSRGYRMCCPAHEDQHASMILWEDESDGHVGLHCFAGCNRADICAALGITETMLYTGARAPNSIAGPPRKLDLLDLTLHKRIHPAVFINAGMQDGYTWNHEGRTIKNVVRVPYLLEDGTPYRRARIRTAITASEGSYWEGDEAPLIPYGLWKLAEARKQKKLWIGEGESDCWAHWSHDIPALGIPGASNTAVLQAEHVHGIETLYLLQEPGEPGKKQDAGKQFIDGMVRRLKAIGYQGECYVVSLSRSHNVKDPSDLHKKLTIEGRVRAYQDELEKAIHEATPLTLTGSAPKPEPLSALQPLIQNAIDKQNIEELYDLAPRVAQLEIKEQALAQAIMKQGMKANSGFSVRMFNKLVKDASTYQAQQNQPVRVTNKPDIMLSGDLEHDAEETLMALYTANVPPVLFVRGAKLARCRISEEHRPFIETVDEAILLYEMVRCANFLSYNQSKGCYLPSYPPIAIARYILKKRDLWRFPALRGITEVPVIREDGTVLDQAGYDSQTHLLYMPHPDLVIPPIPSSPTRQEVEAARDLAWGYIAEFAYETRADGANAFGLLLTVVIRTLVTLVPLCVIDATKQGSGKGLLSKFVSYIASGRSAAAITPLSNEDEWRKTLTSLLVEGETLISLDNVEGLLYSPTLASFLTADLWRARLLGTMQSPELQQRTMMMANGNNVLLGGDIPRRSYRIRMDAGVSKPWQRTGFTYSPLLKYAKQDRGKIIAALLTMVRAWYEAGCPAPAKANPALAEFSGWAELVGGILAFADVDGFLDNLDQLYEEADTEGPAWASFLETWQSILGSGQYTAGEVVKHLKAEPLFAATLPEPLSGLPMDDAKEIKTFSIKLGRALQKRNGTPYGKNNVRLKKTQDTNDKQKRWSVESVPVTTTQPVRLIWSQPAPSVTKQLSTTEPVEILPPTDTTDEVTEQEPAEPLDSLEREPSFTCEAPQCQRGPEEDDSFGFDAYGNAWCGLHGNRQQFLECGSSLPRPFPRLRVKEQIVEGNRAAWTQFAKNADDITFSLAFTAISAQQQDNGERQARE